MSNNDGDDEVEEMVRQEGAAKTPETFRTLKTVGAKSDPRPDHQATTPLPPLFIYFHGIYRPSFTM